jgi:DNA-directed RNA polymerase I, II, and III subunit RPABC2
MSDYLESTNDDFEEESVLEEQEEDEEEDEQLVEEPLQKKVMSKEKVYDQLYHAAHVTTNRLSKYEKARIIGVRAAMIADGAGTLVDPGDLINPIDIARKELAENKCPLMIRRPIPSRNHKKPNYEYRRVSELQKTIQE